MSSLREFWRRLDGPVHPDDAPIFEKYEHSFNLDFPPPAFVGDIDRAPVIVLMSNGGCIQDLREKEFSTEESISSYLEYLTSKTSKPPSTLSDYYRRNWGTWIENGWVALVNAIPYRSKQLSKEPDNRRVAEQLASLRAHKEWLNKEILPQAGEGKRLVIAHRYKWWGLSAKISLPPTILLSDAKRGEPNRSKPNKWKMSLAEDWLYSRGLGPDQNEDTFRGAAQGFGERFSRWGIVMPLAHIRTRQPGLIKKEGWHIQYCFEYDGHTGAIDYVASHRMASGVSHVRIHMDGTSTPLPGPEELMEITENPDENNEIKAEFHRKNKEIEEFLPRKFGVSA